MGPLLTVRSGDWNGMEMKQIGAKESADKAISEMG
jgi:hypothetical protein